MPVESHLRLNVTGTPPSEYSAKFLQGMLTRMGMSFYKYGKVEAAYPHRVNAIESLLIRLLRYLGRSRFEAAVNTALAKADLVEAQSHRRENGNLEYLIDSGNFAMIEFMCPSIECAHFTAEDSQASPGRVWHTGHVGQDSNTHQGESVRTDGLYKREGD